MIIGPDSVRWEPPEDFGAAKMYPDAPPGSRLPKVSAVGCRSGREANCSIPSFDGAAMATACSSVSSAPAPADVAATTPTANADALVTSAARPMRRRALRVTYGASGVGRLDMALRVDGSGRPRADAHPESNNLDADELRPASRAARRARAPPTSRTRIEPLAVVQLVAWRTSRCPRRPRGSRRAR